MEQDYISNCCAAPIIMCDANGHGICLECKDNTVPEELTIPIVELAIQVGVLQEEEQQAINKLFSPAIFWKVVSLLLFLLLFYQRFS